MDVVTADEVDQIAQVATSVDARFQYVDSDGEPTAPGGTPTVTAVDGSGSAVTIGAVSAVSSGTGLYEATVAAADNSSVTELTLTWTESTITYTTAIAIVGSWPFSLAQLKTFDRSTENKTSAALLTARNVTISELIGITGRSPVPAFATAKLRHPAGDTLILPHYDIRTVVAVYDISSTGVETPWSAASVSTLDPSGAGIVYRRSGAFNGGNDIRIDYTFGLNAPKNYLREAMMTRCVWWATREASTLMERTTSWSTGEGGTYRYDMAGEHKTGMPNVDGAYKRFGRVERGVVF